MFPNSFLVSEVHFCFVSDVMECIITVDSLCRAQQGPNHPMQADAPSRAPGGIEAEEEENTRRSLQQGDSGDTCILKEVYLNTLPSSTSPVFPPRIYLQLQ